VEDQAGKGNALVVLVALTATLANLPEDLLERFDINRDLLLGTLALTCSSRCSSIQVPVLLPGRAARGSREHARRDRREPGISTTPLIIAMATMVGFSLINYVVDLLPTGLEKRPKQQSAESIRCCSTPSRGQLVYAQKVLSQNFDPNLVAENGYTPLMYAAARGDTKMVDLLLRNGANVNLVSKSGDHGDRARLGASARRNAPKS